jgi:transposase-like protein
MEGRQRRSLTDDYKRQAVDLVASSGRSIGSVAKELGLRDSVLRRWVELRGAGRGLRGVKLVASDAHEGIKAAVSKVLTAGWQRCPVHFMRNALAHAGKSGRRVVSAFIAAAFAQDDAEAARLQWRKVADQLRPSIPKLARLMNEAEPDVLAFTSFPTSYRAKRHSTNPIERLNGEIKRRTEVVGIFPNEAHQACRRRHPARTK